MAKKSKKDEKEEQKQSKELKKLRKAVKGLQEQNEELVESVEKLRESQEESRKEISTFLGSRSEAPEEPSNELTASADDEISDDEITAEEEPEAVGETPAKPQATESAKRKAEDLGVDLASVEGTGSRSRITVEDVEKAAESG